MCSPYQDRSFGRHEVAPTYAPCSYFRAAEPSIFANHPSDNKTVDFNQSAFGRQSRQFHPINLRFTRFLRKSWHETCHKIRDFGLGLQRRPTSAGLKPQVRSTITISPINHLSHGQSFQLLVYYRKGGR